MQLICVVHYQWLHQAPSPRLELACRHPLLYTYNQSRCWSAVVRDARSWVSASRSGLATPENAMAHDAYSAALASKIALEIMEHATRHVEHCAALEAGMQLATVDSALVLISWIQKN